MTITLRKSLALAARHAAVDQGVSLSGLIAKLLEERLGQNLSYARAWKNQRRLLERGLPIGTHDEIRWTRDDLHEH